MPHSQGLLHLFIHHFDRSFEIEAFAGDAYSVARQWPPTVLAVSGKSVPLERY